MRQTRTSPRRHPQTPPQTTLTLRSGCFSHQHREGRALPRPPKTKGLNKILQFPSAYTAKRESSVVHPSLLQVTTATRGTLGWTSCKILTAPSLREWLDNLNMRKSRPSLSLSTYLNPGLAMHVNHRHPTYTNDVLPKARLFIHGHNDALKIYIRQRLITSCKIPSFPSARTRSSWESWSHDDFRRNCCSTGAASGATGRPRVRRKDTIEAILKECFTCCFCENFLPFFNFFFTIFTQCHSA